MYNYILYCIINYETHGMAFTPLFRGEQLNTTLCRRCYYFNCTITLLSLCEHLIRYSFHSHSMYICELYACECGGNPGASERATSGISVQNARTTHTQPYIHSVRRTAAQHQMVEINLFFYVCLSFANNIINIIHIKSI